MAACIVLNITQDLHTVNGQHIKVYPEVSTLTARNKNGQLALFSATRCSSTVIF